MAKPISPSPVIEGEDAIKIVKEMYKSPSGEYKELAKEIRSQRFVPFKYNYIDFFFKSNYCNGFAVQYLKQHS